MVKLDYTYDELHNKALELLTVPPGQPIHIDYILALTRGGLFFGIIASHLYDIPLIPISYSSKVGKGDDKNHKNELPYFYKRRLLILDDIADSGHSLKEVVRYYKNRENTTTTGVFHCKETSVIAPDMIGWIVPENSGFINYPWEKTSPFVLTT